MRTPDGRCDSEWSGPHTVTSIRSNVGVVIDDDEVTRHISHLRRVPGNDELECSEHDSCMSDEDDNGEEASGVVGETERVLRRSCRVRREPAWLNDYVMYHACEVCWGHVGFIVDGVFLTCVASRADVLCDVIF